MTVHRIMAPDGDAGWRLRAIEWDDVAGTVAGDHRDVPLLAEDLAGPMPIWRTGPQPVYRLADPAHNPADFLVLAIEIRNIGSIFRDRVQLPESLRGVEPTPPLPDNTPPGAVN